jgi:prenyl protein peptidase
MAPVLTLTEAHLLTAFFSISYVGSLYLSKHARLRFDDRRARLAAGRNPYAKIHPSERWRDDPDVIRARLTAVSIATGVSVAVVCGVVYYFMPDPSIRNTSNAWRMALVKTITLLGFLPSSLSPSALWTDVVRPSLVTPALFLGPLYAHYLYGTLPFQLGWKRWFSEVQELMSTWIGLRNYLWV